MDKELRGIVIEIIMVVLLLIIVIPICVSASSEYQNKKNSLLVGEKARVDISNKGEIKEITVSSGVNEPVNLNLMMKISKFNDDYFIYLDDKTFDIRDLEFTEDEKYQYYNLGMYEVTNRKVFQFKIKAKDKTYYDETISYGFYTEGIF